MFICEPCLEKNYTNWAISTSRGKCEDCGNVDYCFDIATSILRRKVSDDAENDGENRN